MSDRRLQLTAAADLDLDTIWRFVAHRSGSAAADRLEAALHRTMRRLAHSPGMGSLRTDLAAIPVRVFPHRPYVFVYRERRDGIDVVRVLHAARDVASLDLGAFTQPP
jgi:toxin ParE1/3/4